ncbi:hypothetical protein GCM10009118_13370 [Wandonia haliotis]|uniref:Lipoprotein n=1 Tax=Wandonia haliotis TaxID=574963 RepID=A0ABN1MNU6_9FLAO
MKRIRYIAIYGVLIIGLMGCKKEVANPDSSNLNVLPPLTHEGKNTFGCLVNGEVWVAYAPFTVGGTIALEGSYHSDIGYLHLRGNRKNNDLNHNESINLRIENLFSSGTFTFYTNHHVSRGLVDYSDNFNCSNYYLDTNLIRESTITYFSLQKRIVSGTFEMDLVNPSCPGDTIKIREGRFDWCY